MVSFLKKRGKRQHPYCVAIVAAAGHSSRMGGVDKLMESLWGIPVLARSLQALEQAQRIDEIIIAVREEEIVAISQLCVTYEINK